MIKVENLSVSYGKGLPDVICDMSFELEKGCILNILRQNAVGKTTLIRTLMRELQNYRGSIKVGVNEISSYSIRDDARIMGVVSTSFSTYQNLLVADYLVTGLLNQIQKLADQGYTVLVTTHNPGHAYSMGGKTLMMGKGKYCFGDTHDVITAITAQNLSEYYELDVTMQPADGFQYMVFQNADNPDGVKLVF